MQTLTISLLGSPFLAVDDDPISVDTRKAVAMVAYLALNPGVQTRDGLAVLLWPELNRSRGRAALRRTLFALNRSAIVPWLIVERTTVELHVDNFVEVDIDTFQRLVADCLQHGHAADAVCPRCIEPLTAAAALYRADFMSGFTLRDSVNFDDWQFFMAEELRRAYLHALDRLVAALAADGQYQAAIEQARRRLRVDALNEATHRQLMLLFVWAGQRNAALRQYRECVRILDDELGVPPLDETTALYEEIYANQSDSRPQSVVRQPLEVTLPAQPAPSQARSVPPMDLVGREAAWSALEGALLSAHNGHLVIIVGESGIGKTALMRRFLEQVAGQGHLTLSARCYDGESELAYAPIRDLLRKGVLGRESEQWREAVAEQWIAEAARLVPELDTAMQAPVDRSVSDDPAAKGHFFEGISQVLWALAAGPVPSCIAVDNVHWADTATLEVLGYLARRLAGRSICLLLAWRSDELAGNEARRRIGYDAIQEIDKTRVRLDRLQASDVSQLLAMLEPVDAGTLGDLADRLMGLSSGIPLFLVEYLELLKQSPALMEESDWALPGGIRSLLQSRLDPVSDTGRQLLTAAAVIGRSFDYEMLRAVSGRNDDETVLALEELLALRLVRELAGSAYDFYHDQLRSLVYTEMSRARRRLLHRRVAGTLASARRGESGEQRLHSATLAFHYAEGDQVDEAIGAYIEAAEQAASVYANREAIQYLESALALGSLDVAFIHERLGDLHMLLGEYAPARAAYESAAAHVDGGRRPRLTGKLGDLHQRLGNLPLADSHYENALADEQLEAIWRCRILAGRSLLAGQRGDAQAALAWARESLATATQLDAAPAMAEAHNVLSILARHAGDAQGAVAGARRSLELAEESRSAAARAAALNSLALALAAAGNYRQAIELTEDALVDSLARGDRHRAAALHDHLADYHHALGESAAAETHTREAVLLFAQISADGLELNPQIWKLVEW